MKNGAVMKNGATYQRRRFSLYLTLLIRHHHFRPSHPKPYIYNNDGTVQVF